MFFIIMLRVFLAIINVCFVFLQLVTISTPVIRITAPRATGAIALAFAFPLPAASAFALSSFALSFLAFAFALLAAGAEPVQLILQLGLIFEPLGSRVLPVLAIVLIICCL